MKRVTLYLIILIVLLYVLDQISKWYIVFNYDLPTPFFMDSTPVITGSSIMNFNIVRLHNTGVAFGLGNGTAWAPFLFLGVQVVALVVLTILYRRNFFYNRTLKVAWACIMTGVLGNMTDRLTQGFFLPGAESLGFFQNLINGYVVDFLDFSFPWIPAQGFVDGYHWPSFNVADSCVCIAAGLFLIASFMPQPKPEEKKEEPKAEKKEEETASEKE
ncbi:MAG: signal peptidase II [Akkermansia sp.]|nr:signal peptidase II [Akkermansia sp.]